MRVVLALGMPGTFSNHWIHRKALVSDPGMHLGTCVTHVPWCMSGSLVRGSGENVLGNPKFYTSGKRPVPWLPMTYRCKDPAHQSRGGGGGGGGWGTPYVMGDTYVPRFWPPFFTLAGSSTIFLGCFFSSTNTKTIFWVQILAKFDLLGPKIPFFPRSFWVQFYGSAEGPPRVVENRNLLSHPDDLRVEAYVIRMT